jgi:NAD(P)-dependent dehydrogenase (short-subunit alcohol dehydrogenase family)
MHPLYGKVVLITGGSSGIGRAIALRLAGCGSRVAIAARNPDALADVARAIQALGAEGLVLPTDVTEAAQVGRTVEATVARFGGLDILICSAGLSMRAYFEGSSLDAMERVVRVNLLGTLYATHFALPHVKCRRGSLVAISSLTGMRGIPSYAVYGASKFAIHGLYESLRVELRRDGVHVGLVAPGFVDTPLRTNVIGPDGKPWPEPPPPPFRIWPVKKCVDRVVRLIVQRRAAALLPAFTGPLLGIEHFLGSWLGDAILARRFPPDHPGVK